MKTKILKFIKRHHRTILLAGLVALAVTLVIPNPAFAQAAQPAAGNVNPPTESTAEQEIISKMLTVCIQISTAFSRILWPILLLIGGLLKNDILYNSGMETRLLDLWGQMRDFVNILFVLVLLAIAFYNVMGGSDQSFQIKTVLPKFVIALILVNFSYIGIKVVLDGVNVLTTAIFALPASVTEERGKLATESPDSQVPYCEGIYSKTYYQQSQRDAAEKDPNGLLCDENRHFTAKAKEFFRTYDGNNAAIAIALNLGNVSSLDDVYAAKVNLKLHDLFINSIFSVIFYVIYTTAFVCMFVVLVARLCVLWLCIVISPFAALLYVLPEKMKGMVTGGEMNVKEQFINHAFIPIPIALVMTIGFILLQGFKMGQTQRVGMDTSTLGIGFLASGTSTLQDLIIGVAMVGFLWKGIFAAMDKTVAKSVVDKIKGGVGAVGKFVGDSWKYIPFLPVSTAEGSTKLSLAGMEEMMRQVDSSRISDASKQAGDAARLMGMNTDQVAQNMRAAKTDKDLKVGIREALDKKVAGKAHIQKGFAESLETTPGMKQGFRKYWEGLTGPKGGSYDEFLKMMKEGQVDETVAQRFMAAAAAGVKSKPATAAAAAGVAAAGAAATRGAKGEKATVAKANEDLERNKEGRENISAESKKALEDYEKQKDPKEKQKQAESDEVQRALGELETQAQIERNRGGMDNVGADNKKIIEDYQKETDSKKKQKIAQGGAFQNALNELGIAAQHKRDDSAAPARAFKASAVAAMDAKKPEDLATAIRARRQLLHEENSDLTDAQADQKIMEELGEDGRKKGREMARSQKGGKIEGISFAEPAAAPAAKPAAAGTAAPATTPARTGTAAPAAAAKAPVAAGATEDNPRLITVEEAKKLGMEANDTSVRHDGKGYVKIKR
jgi:hypothetical protein